VRHPQYSGLLMAAFGIAIITRSETRLAVAALLWFVLDRKVGGARCLRRLQVTHTVGMHVGSTAC
jgi:protein-S-isoprenylcysteine O-methyltransferase Ste14